MDPLHEIAVSAFSRSLLGLVNTLEFLSLFSQPSRISPRVGARPLFIYFLALAFALFLYLLLRLSCTLQTHLWTAVSLFFVPCILSLRGVGVMYLWPLLEFSGQLLSDIIN